jgi:hypothetical protein
MPIDPGDLHPRNKLSSMDFSPGGRLMHFRDVQPEKKASFPTDLIDAGRSAEAREAQP